MHKMTQRMDRESSVRGLRMMVGYLRRYRAARLLPRHRTSPWVGDGWVRYGALARGRRGRCRGALLRMRYG